MSRPVFSSALAHRPDNAGAKGLNITMREISDRGMIDLRGEASSTRFKQAIKAALGVDLPTKPRTSISKGDIVVFWLSVDQWLVCCPRDKAGALAGKMRNELGSLHSLVVEVSDMRAIITLEGENVPEVLMKGSAIDFTLPEYKQGLVRRFIFAEIAALVHIVSDNPYRADIFVFRSYADYTWKWLLATAKPVATIGLFKSGK
ncbi:MAG: sarcosine oxidase subunit gamma family protein [Anderseniella sp.]